MALRKDHTIEALRMLNKYPVTITEENLVNKDEVTINEETITKPRLHRLPMKASSKYISVHQEIISVTCDEDKLKYLVDYFDDENIPVTRSGQQMKIDDNHESMASKVKAEAHLEPRRG